MNIRELCIVSAGGKNFQWKSSNTRFPFEWQFRKYMYRNLSVKDSSSFLSGFLIISFELFACVLATIELEYNIWNSSSNVLFYFFKGKLSSHKIQS